MIIENKGILTDSFYVPPFTLAEGDIIGLYLYNGLHFFETEMFLKNIFTGKTSHENVEINKELTFVEHIIESNLRRFLFPMTVG